ncbi:MAG TPA: NAD(P)-dependent oxidoreductase [Kiritimatiellia bacterium]|nr:NAD(P)-dependent oxidoreductase [Kiritimatiellia bacterium]
MRILVTGASGFIGSHLCRALVADGATVVGVSREHPDALPDGITPTQADLTDPEQATALIACHRPDVIYHLASCVTGGRDISLVRPTFTANLAATVYLMEAASRAGCRRFVLTGSLEEPDHAQAPPSSPYAAAKAAATAYARMFHALYTFPAVIARVFMVYGPDQRDEKKLVPYVINQLLAGTSPRMSSGTRMVDWIYVQDVVEGLIRLARAEGVAGKTIDLGSGEMTSVRSVVEQIAGLMGNPTALHFDAAADRPMEQVRIANIQETEAAIAWRPRFSLSEGLQATIDWHRRRRPPVTHA